MIAGGTRLPSADEAEALAAECREELQVPSVDAAVFFPTLVGSSFLEQHHDRALRGYPGRSERVVRAERAFEREVRVVRPVVDGEDLRTTLRRDLQRTALEIVAAAPEGGHGAAVVLDVRTGAVVALASTDRDGLDHARSHVIPGSVYKLVTAVALLESGHAPTETLSCEGSARIAAGGRYVCHNRGGDGEIALHRAFVRSCNGYFAQQAVASGADALLDAATRLGLGARPLLDTFGARCSTPAGLECSRPAVHPDKWKVWDLAQIGIGQGAASASPLQIAVAYARIASGGRVLHPWLLERDRPPAGTIPVDPVLARWAPILRAAARGVVDDSGDGTASGQSALVALRAAGKTGTADVRGPGGTTTNNTIFVGYAPHDDPRYCAVVAFQGMPERRYGGDAAAEPVARLLAEALRE
jgi:cell division protein FtsI/penicillin-binding protein 2